MTVVHIWCSSPYATFAIVMRDGIVVEAAPIGRWMIGRDKSLRDDWRARGMEFRRLRVDSRLLLD